MLMKTTRLTFFSHVHDVYVLKPCITRTSTEQIRNANTHCGSHCKHNAANTWKIWAGAKLGHASNCCLHLTALSMLVSRLHCTWVDHWIVVQIKLSSRKTVCCGQVALSLVDSGMLPTVIKVSKSCTAQKHSHFFLNF